MLGIIFAGVGVGVGERTMPGKGRHAGQDGFVASGEGKEVEEAAPAASLGEEGVACPQMSKSPSVQKGCVSEGVDPVTLDEV